MNQFTREVNETDFVENQKLSPRSFARSFTQEHFSNANRPKMQILDYVIKNRIIKDSDFNQIYEHLL